MKDWPVFNDKAGSIAQNAKTSRCLTARIVDQALPTLVHNGGEVVSTIGPANVNLKEARLSPDGKKIATPIFDVDRGANDMWIIGCANGSRAAVDCWAWHRRQPRVGAGLE